MKQGFNFLKPQVEPPSAWTKVYEWVVGTAKVILMVAIVAVIIAMIIRVVLDVQSNQLDEQTKNLESLMQVREKEELKYRELQKRIASYEAAWTSTNINSPVVELILSILPLSATELDVNLQESTLNIKGIAENSDIDLMEEALKTDKSFTQAQLSRLEVSGAEGETLVKFDFQAKITAFDKKTLSE